MKKFFSIFIFIIIVLVIGALSVAHYLKSGIEKKIMKERIELFESSQDSLIELITKDEVEKLPDPVQRYMKKLNIIGKHKFKNARIKQKGEYKFKPTDKWIPFESTEYVNTNPPGYIWHSIMKPYPMTFIIGKDKFFQNEDSQFMKLMSVYKLDEFEGPEANKSALVKYLNSIIWFPSAYLNENIHWEPIDELSAKATITTETDTVSATLYFDYNSDLMNFFSKRYLRVDSTSVLHGWATPFYDYKVINGFRMPSKVEWIWKIGFNDFVYMKYEILDVAYNLDTKEKKGTIAPIKSK